MPLQQRCRALIAMPDVPKHYNVMYTYLPATLFAEIVLHFTMIYKLSMCFRYSRMAIRSHLLQRHSLTLKVPFDSNTDSHPCHGVTFAISNACTLSLVKFDDAAGNKLVLEGYWELRGDILTKGRGRCVANALQRVLESVTWAKSYLDLASEVFLELPWTMNFLSIWATDVATIVGQKRGSRSEKIENLDFWIPCESDHPGVKSLATTCLGHF